MADTNGGSKTSRITVRLGRQECGFNNDYLKSFHAVAKLLESVLQLTAFINSFIMSQSNKLEALAWTKAFGGAFVDVVTLLGAVISLVLFGLCAFGVWWRLPSKLHCSLELVYYSCFAVFMVTCSVLCLRFNSMLFNSTLMAGVMCCMATVVFSMETAFALLKLWALVGLSWQSVYGLPIQLSSLPAQDF